MLPISQFFALLIEPIVRFKPVIIIGALVVKQFSWPLIDIGVQPVEFKRVVPIVLFPVAKLVVLIVQSIERVESVVIAGAFVQFVE